ncbi:MAG: type II toxin-antitoxin system VapC family toxin [Tissierellia bacterium]|nr:type II toxin-antitoxin system VapC family toxin [Tissierellia bacterium]
MAKRICFISEPHNHPVFREIKVEFKYYSGFAVSQKQKSIIELHQSINRLYPNLKVLEISTKSLDPLGVALSAFNLRFYDDLRNKEYPLENIFQSSKVFEFGGPYRDLLNVQPKDAKRDERLKSSGNLVCFNYNDKIWQLEPKTMFYDWLYITALERSHGLAKKILEYDAFTDIEFNHEKSINCQARAAAIYVSLSKNNKLTEVLNNQEEFRKLYDIQVENIQTTLFD